MPRSPEELRLCLRGLIGFGVTPFHEDFSINELGLRQNATTLAETCDAVVALGNVGEIFSLSAAEQKLVGRVVASEVHARKPVLVGVGFCLPVARDLAQTAEGYGADAVLLLPPEVAQANDDGLFEYYRSIASSINIGVVLFQTRTVNFSTSLLRRLAEIPNIVALKDEHGDMEQAVRQIAAVGDRIEMLCGVGEILAPSYFALGVNAFTSGIVNFMPSTSLRILAQLREGRMQAAARVVQEEVISIFDLRRKRPGYSTVIIKEALNLCGVNVGPVRPPLTALPPADREELISLLERFGLLKAPQITADSSV